MPPRSGDSGATSEIDVSEEVNEASKTAAEHVTSAVAIVSPSSGDDAGAQTPEEDPGAVTSDQDERSADAASPEAPTEQGATDRDSSEDQDSSEDLDSSEDRDSKEQQGQEAEQEEAGQEEAGHEAAEDEEPEHEEPGSGESGSAEAEPQGQPGVETRGTPIAAVAVVKLRRAWRNAKRAVSSLRVRQTGQDEASEPASVVESGKISPDASASSEGDASPEVVEPQAVEPEAAVPGRIDEAPDADASAPEQDASGGREEDRGTVVIESLSKRYGENYAVEDVSLTIPAGSFYGIVGPNGAGKTTTLSMMTGLLRPDAGQVRVNGIDVWKRQAKAKRTMGVLPDRMRLFDRLTGAQLLYYSGVLRGLDNVTVRARVQSLARAFGLEDAIGRLVSDYSVGMSKKVALASALIHSPRVLVLDEPFESVDPVSAASITEILQKYVDNGGTVILSSHGMEFIERVCDKVAVIVGGKILASGTVDEVREDKTLEERLIELVGGLKATEDLEWLHSFSD